MDIGQKKNFIINSCFYIIITILIVLSFKYILPFVVPFLIGFAIVYFLRTPMILINKKLKIPYKVSAVSVLIFFYLTVGLLIALISLWGIQGIQSFISELPALYTMYAEQIVTNLTEYIENIILVLGNNQDLVVMVEEGIRELISAISGLITTISTSIVSWLSNVVISVPGFFIKLVLMMISTFFIALDYEKIIDFCKKQVGNKASKLITEIKDYLFGTVFVCIKSYALIMSITFIELSIGLTIIGVENSIIIALLTACLDILPVLGTGGVMIPWSIISLIMGDIGVGIGLIVVYLVVTVIRNIIEPKIVGTQLGLHPLATLISMFIGVNIAGIIGLFGFPIMLSLLLHLNKHGVIKLLKN